MSEVNRMLGSGASGGVSMDAPAYVDRSRGATGSQGGDRGLPQGLETLFRSLRARAGGLRRWKGPAAVIASLALGLWADQAARERHLLHWRAEEGPSTRVWRRALDAEGFQELSHESAHRRVIR